jgi:hypothetical protein
MPGPEDNNYWCLLSAYMTNTTHDIFATFCITMPAVVLRNWGTENLWNLLKVMQLELEEPGCETKLSGSRDFALTYYASVFYIFPFIDLDGIGRANDWMKVSQAGVWPGPHSSSPVKPCPCPDWYWVPIVLASSLHWGRRKHLDGWPWWLISLFFLHPTLGNQILGALGSNCVWSDTSFWGLRSHEPLYWSSWKVWWTFHTCQHWLLMSPGWEEWFVLAFPEELCQVSITVKSWVDAE